jgi:hypothetical protein
VNYPSQPSFFGLTSNYKKEMLYEMYILIKHGNYSYSDLLIMPVYERKLMLDFLIDEAEERNKRNENRKETN